MAIVRELDFSRYLYISVWKWNNEPGVLFCEWPNLKEKNLAKNFDLVGKNYKMSGKLFFICRRHPPNRENYIESFTVKMAG